MILVYCYICHFLSTTCRLLTSWVYGETSFSWSLIPPSVTPFEILSYPRRMSVGTVAWPWTCHPLSLPWATSRDRRSTTPTCLSRSLCSLGIARHRSCSLIEPSWAGRGFPFIELCWFHSRTGHWLVMLVHCFIWNATKCLMLFVSPWLQQCCPIRAESTPGKA